MTDAYLTFLEAVSDPWALGFVSFLLAGLIVLCGALVMDPRPLIVEDDVETQTPQHFLEPLQYESEDFFDKVTRFHHEV